MSKLTVPLVILAAAGIAGAAWQTYEASAERKRSTLLGEMIEKVEARAAALEKDVARLQGQNAIFQSESEQLRSKLAGKRGSTGADADPVPGAGPVGADGKPEATAAEGAKGFMKTMAKMMKDPEMKKAMRAQQAMGMQMMYGDLGKELGITPEQSAQLMEILTDRQLAMSEQSMEMMDGAKGDAGKLTELTNSIQASKQEYDDRIKEALGAETYQRFQEYEGSMGERMAVNQLQQQFTAKGMAMNDNERQTLMQLMAEERKSAPATWDPSGANAAEQMKAMQSEDGIARMMEQQRQTNQRVLKRATQFLSPDQVNQLRESQDQFLKMQEMGMKMGQSMFKEE
jgi:hypothetical protein